MPDVVGFVGWIESICKDILTKGRSGTLKFSFALHCVLCRVQLRDVSNLFQFAINRCNGIFGATHIPVLVFVR